MLQHGDGFGTYGTGIAARAQLLLGEYADANSSAEVRTTPLAGIGTHCFLSPTNAGEIGLRKVFRSGPITEVILGGRFRIDSLPTGTIRTVYHQPRDGSNGAQCSLTVSSTGLLQVRTGNNLGTVVAQSASPCIIAGTYQFVEMYVRIGNTGEVEVRVDGVVVISATGIDTQGTALTTAAQTMYAIAGAGSPSIFMMDTYICDLTGTVNNDFLGDTQWVTVFPNSDGSVSDWVRNTGSDDWATLDENPQDGDTTYVEANIVGDISEFGMQDLPGTVAEVIGLITRPVMRKTSAGDGSAQVGVISALASPETSVSGLNRAMTETYTFYSDVFETDPETGAVWSVAAVNAVRLKLERTL